MKSKITIFTFLIATLYSSQTLTTQSRENAGAPTTQSGFYQAEHPVNYPAGATSFWHLLDVRHTNTINNYGMQFAGSFFDQELWFRKTNTSTLSDATTSWSKIVLQKPAGNVEIFNQAANGHLKLAANDVSDADQSRIDIDFHISNRNQTIARIASRYENSNNGGYGGLRFSTSEAGQIKERLTISPSGKVGIGYIYPKNELDVNGTVHAKEVKVDLNGWADFVFKKEYQLPSLESVEKHIKEKGHLPSIPSEAEISKNGLSLGENQKLLLQKIEELTLYSIEQNKQLKVQNEQLNIQAQKIEKLENALTTQKTK